MVTELLPVLGGLGVFLLGMSVMTEGLKDLAGNALRKALAHFTKNPVTGAITGTISTALIQSSSATTVMAVGFVGAGLLTFPQSLGIIFGANIGTTVTGWLVALLGFKLSLSKMVMPLIFVGALLRLFGKRRLAAAGYALAGFGLVFTGISMLQGGMEGFKDVVTPESFPPNTFFGRILLVLLGVIITLVTQSSSAGVATAVTAVHVGNIELAQAAALIIGMDVGTTATAAIATLGGNTAARRTGLAHVIYNLLTGLSAFILLPLYIWGWDRIAPTAAQQDPEIALVAFHTLFNFLGVVVALPFTEHFAQLIIRVIPTKESPLTRRLQPQLLKEPAVAIANVQATILDLSSESLECLREILQSGASTPTVIQKLSFINDAISKTRRFLSQIAVEENGTGDEHVYKLHVRALHVLDHLARLNRRCSETLPLKTALEAGTLAANAKRLGELLEAPIDELPSRLQLDEQLEALWKLVDSELEPYRRSVMQATASGERTIEETLQLLDASRWVRRLCYHSWRIVHHLAKEVTLTEMESELTDVE